MEKSPGRGVVVGTWHQHLGEILGKVKTYHALEGRVGDWLGVADTNHTAWGGI